jgi:tellurite resistance-related uncharacterized protein
MWSTVGVPDSSLELPDGLVLDRVTRDFTPESVPPGLLRAHRVADGVWGRLLVREGSLVFVFEDDPDGARDIPAGGTQVIPPGRFHHLEVSGPARFAVEFHVPGS